jgi:glucose-6-phosphate-specific signal transduction histidine kinase
VTVPKSLLKRKPNRLVNSQTEKKIALQRVLQELMVNMKNIAASFGSLVLIAIKKNLKIDYSDNGVGFRKTSF